MPLAERPKNILHVQYVGLFVTRDTLCVSESNFPNHNIRCKNVREIDSSKSRSGAFLKILQKLGFFNSTTEHKIEVNWPHAPGFQIFFNPSYTKIKRADRPSKLCAMSGINYSVNPSM